MSTDATSESAAATGSGSAGGPELEIRQKALQEELRELVDVVGPGPLVDLLLERAFQLHATDVHLDPMENGLRVRLRVDGMLHDVLELPARVTAQVISRLKILGGMDITERRLAQDGHISQAVLKHHRDIRVGGGPTIHGERIVLRLMPDDASLTNLEELGFESAQLALVKKMADIPYGVLLAVGPVGSGKSTTMYSCLSLRNRPTESVVTIEDPVERRITGVNQIQVDPRIDFTFVKALRGVLRQDPDVMMIGEIRDPETAHIGVRAGLTGVTVLSTLHASDSLAAVDVFHEFGVPPTFIVDAIKCVVAQRLIRVICKSCREEYAVDQVAREALNLTEQEAAAATLARGKGCDACFQTGYFGRTGVFEVLRLFPELRSAVLKQNSKDELRKIVNDSGLMTLDQAGRAKVLRGETTVEELLRLQTAFAI
ncbi:MAG: GspE/PulE family protein [Planctomycetota bacterium]|nr:GspE/PulE family protein [Planctomycetota bacterium]MDA1250001.1 GspE/PulE family protein [Planctomycetota bacterium]